MTKEIRTVFWNVDTQRDFMDVNGSLYVPGAIEIKPNLKRLTTLSREHDIQVVNTGDWHTKDSQEISDKPDFVNTYPAHCMAGTSGAQYISETEPRRNSAILPWAAIPEQKDKALREVREGRDIIIYKDVFDVFDKKGNQYTEQVLEAINPDRVVVYGVATNVCVDFAVQGLLARDKEVYFVQDAIAGLPGKPITSLPDPFELQGLWRQQGAKSVTTDTLERLLRWTQ